MHHKQPTSTAVKTAEEILSNSGLACEYVYNVKVLPLEDCIKAMKLYANAKLDEAAEIAETEIFYGYYINGDPHYQVNKQSILSLKEEI